MPIPIPQLDDTRFQTLVDEAKLLLPRYAPTWTDYNVHDPGITLIELFAWLAETQIYTLDQITDWHRTKFLRLLDCPPKPARPARAAVTFTLPPDRTEAVYVPQGTRLVGRRAGAERTVLFETTRDLWVVPAALELVRIERRGAQQGRMDMTEAWKRGLYFFALGGELGDAIEVGDSLRLGFSAAFPRQEVTLTVTLYDADLPPVGAHGDETPDVVPSAEVAWEYLAADNRWCPLPGLVDETRALSVSGAVRFSGPADPLAVRDGPQTLYWLRLRVTRSGYELPPRIAALSLNTVPAAEGCVVSVRPVGSGTGLPSQRLALEDAPLVPESMVLEVQEHPEGAWEVWTRVPDFDASTPEDRHFTLDAAAGVLGFGNGFRGRIVPRGTGNIRASYRLGGGERGNLAAGEIRRVQAPGLEDIQVTNVQPASGGTEPESLASAWQRLKADLVTPYRAVTSEDFESLATATPGLRVARAKALPGFDPQRPSAFVQSVVTVVVVPYSFSDRPTPSAGFLRTVCCHLDRHRLITTALRVVAPRYVRVSVTAAVTVTPQSAPPAVGARAVQALTDFLHPLRGGRSGTGWPFGRPVYYSELVSVIEGLAGVECIEVLQLYATGPGVPRGDDILIPQDALVYPGHVQIDAREPRPFCEVQPCQSHA